MLTKGNSSVACLIAIGLLFTAFGAMAADYSGGSGTEEDPYQIGTVGDWIMLSWFSTDWDKKYFILAEDIYFNGEDLEPIGNSSVPFTGEFNGNGHVLSNGRIYHVSDDYVGYFGYLDTGGKIRNLEIKSVDVIGKDYTGGLVGMNSGIVSSCYVTGEVSGDNRTGGLAGYNYGIIESCNAMCKRVSGDNNVGGLIGYNDGIVQSSYFTVEGVLAGAWGGYYVGGLVGRNSTDGIIMYCYSTGESTGTEYVGGLVGSNSGSISFCYAMGPSSGDKYVGGLAGYNGDFLMDCYSTGWVNGENDVGGLVGKSNGGTTILSYWNKSTSKQSISAGGEGRFTSEMTYPYSENTYVGWSFTTVWAGSREVNSGYPYLQSCTVCMNNLDCDDGDLCTEDICHPLTGCEFKPITCDDGDVCNGLETCDPIIGCQQGAPLECDDSIACTVDSCAPLEGCINMPDDTLCDDGVACTVDSCDPATGCVYTPDDTLCSDGDACNGLETCDATNGCQPGTPLECDDGIACTIDNCDPATGCVFTPDNTLCDDGDACTIDHCDPYMGCMYEDFPVNDGNACTIDICDPVTGVAYEAVDCNDDDACTIDSCDPATGCHYEDISCDDADACTIDSCDPATGCVNTPVNCDDGDPTTEDACDPATGTCLHTPLPVPHPADINEDYRLVLSETIAYLAGWQQGANPIGHAIRAAYLWQNGEYYSYDPTETPPLCWILPEPAEGEGEPIEGEDKTVFLPGDIPLEMLWIPGGSFLMGRYSEELDSEVSEDPQHTVTLQHGFWMGKYEVTQKQWLAVVGSWPNVDQPSEAYGVGDDYPAYYVSWYNVKDFITALNTHLENTDQDLFTLRLPSEAEWEYACRAGTNTRFHWGDDLLYEQLGDHAWYRFNSSDKTHPIGLKLENAFGLHDMSGNVWEWCEDDLHDNYVGAPTDGSAWVDSPRASKRVVRGGSWANLIWRCRSANRGLGSSESGYNFGGFRLVAD